ncbi:(2Fe-2S)-binding protein [Vannielia litorea]|uniref:(2Fe-2S)-binding protein n=1 Tax=Vannielia litorea TaxID=1217970 RepID=UPI001C9556EB|nr:(2Fe-2S)-binding protein [Vannielia litorea]MBY6153791.1 (2Fe-2S)-binding protein [Vannielia litorea]
MFNSVLEGSERGAPVTVTVEGEPVQAWEGETVASVLLRHFGTARRTPVSQAPRAPFCMMGVCFDCLAVIDGEGSAQSCLVPIRAGMVISRQNGAREVTQ